MARPNVQVLLDDTNLTPELQTRLAELDAQITIEPFSADSQRTLELHQGRLVLSQDGRSMTNGKLHRLLEWFDRDPCATLVACDVPVPSEFNLSDAVAERAIRFVGGESIPNVLTQLMAMCSLHRTFDALRQELLELRRRDDALLASLKQLQDELRLAGRIQRELLRSAAPPVRGATLRILHRPAGEVSGDIHHVARLDDSRVALAVADATGHGFAAGLLSAFVERGISRGLRDLSTSTEVSPGDILGRLNRELIDADLKDCHFVTAVLAVYDESSHVLCWARAGAPHPVLVRPGEAARLLHTEGILLGIDRAAGFATGQVQLTPGDTVLLHTDGVECGTHGVDLLTDPQRHLESLAASAAPLEDDLTALLLHVS